MGFFQTFWSWLSTQLTDYIGNNTMLIASALEPAVITLASIYVMMWGYLQATGRIDEPIVLGIRRIVVLTVVLGVALHLWLYNSVIVDTFYAAPAQLAAAIVGGGDPVATIDAIWQQGGAVGEQLWNKGGILNGDMGFYLAGLIVWLLVGLLCIYAMFLIALSSIASSVLLAIGPLFIVMLLFDSTRRYFEAWIGQLTNYALITILTVLVSALLLQIVSSYAAQTAARGGALLTMDALDMVLISALVFLLLRQVMPIAAGLAAGPALQGFGAMAQLLAASAGLGLAAGRGVVASARIFGMAREKASASAKYQVSSEPPSWRDPI
jgi:type IV secretion system protein VirB6